MTNGALILVVILAFMANVAIIRSIWRWNRLHVEVGPSYNGRQRVEHHISARLMKRGTVLHFERVDMRKPDWEATLALRVSEMQQKRKVLQELGHIAEQ